MHVKREVSAEEAEKARSYEPAAMDAPGLDLEESVRLANGRLALLSRSVMRLEGSLDQIRLALGSRNGSRLADLEAAVAKLEGEVRLLRHAAHVHPPEVPTELVSQLLAAGKKVAP